MANKREEWASGYCRDPEHRKTHATGNHEVPSDADALQTGYTRSPMTGVKDRYTDDGVRRQPQYDGDYDE